MHRADIHCLAFSPDSQMLAWGSKDQVKLWTACVRIAARFCRTWNTTTLKGHTEEVRSPWRFHPMVAILASAGRDKTVKTLGHFDWTKYPYPRTYEADHRMSRFHPMATILAAGRVGGEIELWDVSTGQNPTTFGKHQGRGFLCSVFARWKNPRFRGMDSGEIKLWDIATETETLLHWKDIPVLPFL